MPVNGQLTLVYLTSSSQFHHAAKITLADGVPIAQLARDQGSYRRMLCECLSRAAPE